MNRNEDYFQLRVPASEFHEVVGRIGKTFAYHRLSSRDGVWGLTWDLTCQLNLEAAELEIRARKAALRAAWRHLSPEARVEVQNAYEAAQNA